MISAHVKWKISCLSLSVLSEKKGTYIKIIVIIENYCITFSLIGGIPLVLD